MKSFTEFRNRGKLNEGLSLLGKNIILGGSKGRVIRGVERTGVAPESEIYQVKFDDGTLLNLPAKEIMQWVAESVELDEIKWDKDERRIVPKWEKDLHKATSKIKGIVRGLKNGKEVHSYRTGGTMMTSAVGVLMRDFGADTVELVVRGKVVYTVKKNDVMKNGKMIDESVELDEDNTAAIAKQVKQAVKKYTTGKLAVQSKGGKTRFIMVRADKIDNELRKKVLNVVAPKANVRDKSNISYGNISDRIISASVEQWMKALNIKV